MCVGSGDSEIGFDVEGVQPPPLPVDMVELTLVEIETINNLASEVIAPGIYDLPDKMR